jgi:hypothetical protein
MAARASWQEDKGRTASAMLSKASWARIAALSTLVAAATAAIPVGTVFAQESPSVALEQARSGEDGTSGAGAASGGFSTGNTKRDKNGNGGNASAGSAGEPAVADGSGEAAGEAPLPENAELLDALGILDDVTTYELDVLTGLDIPVELLPPPAAEPAPDTATDVNTGGQGGEGATSNVSTDPGNGAAPAGGATNTAAEDGSGSSASGEPKRDRPKKHADDGAATDGATDTATATG